MPRRKRSKFRNLKLLTDQRIDKILSSIPEHVLLKMTVEELLTHLNNHKD